MTSQNARAAESHHLSIEELLRLLDLRRLDGNSFEGESAPFPHGRVFGGQVMAQGIIAAGRTVPERRRIHSAYSYFLAPAQAGEPLRFTVDALRDGGSFSVRHVRALQEETTVLEMTCSFQVPQDGRIHQDKAPEVPAPETLPTTRDLLGHLDSPEAQYVAGARPFDIRHASAPLYLQPASERSGSQIMWMRATSRFTASPLEHDALLAFASDYTPFEPMLRRQGLSWVSPGLKMATIDHAIWWHDHHDADQWLLYVLDSPAASGGRGLTTGSLFRADGSLVAQITQEGMLRVPEEREGQGPAPAA